MSGSGKVSTEGGTPLGQNPFGALDAAGLPAAPKPGHGGGGSPTASRDSRNDPTRRTGNYSAVPAAHEKNRGRVDIKRTTAGRGGKIVTLVTGFTGIGLPEKESLAKKMRNACGCGGTVKEGDIEIQGDQRETVARILREAGFRPVMAGG